jgi:hypothetical protein
MYAECPFCWLSRGRRPLFAYRATISGRLRLPADAFAPEMPGMPNRRVSEDADRAGVANAKKSLTLDCLISMTRSTGRWPA